MQTSFVLTLFAIGALVGLIAGWISRGPREARFRLINKPKKTRLEVLVPPGPAPRLIPGDSPRATRARSTGAPVPPAGGRAYTVINYSAAFAGSAEASKDVRIDYLLVSSDSVGESRDPQAAAPSIRYR